MIYDNTSEQFFELVRAGLFPGNAARVLVHGATVDWHAIYALAEEQSVAGLVAAGIDSLPSSERPPQSVVLQFVGTTLQLEQRNKEMNAFVAQLIDGLRKNDVYTLLVKGQGIAQCYEKPLWRACGDVDLLLSESNYEKAKAYLMPLATSVDKEDRTRQHLAMKIDGWVVELHGSLKSKLWRNLDKGIDAVQRSVFYGGCVRSVEFHGTNTSVQEQQGGQSRIQVFLPGANEDVFLVFAHILQHFFREGIGLRQICDWIRLLWKYRESLDHGLLESRIRKAGIMTEWKVFASLAVNCLRMPMEAMPLFDDNDNHNANLKRKAKRVVAYMLKTGNFGHNKDNSYRERKSLVARKAISIWRYTQETVERFLVFPLDSLRVWGMIVMNGVKGLWLRC